MQIPDEFTIEVHEEAADAFSIARNPMPSRNEGLIVRGRPTRRARLAEAVIELPEQPLRASFFAVQEEA